MWNWFKSDEVSKQRLGHDYHIAWETVYTYKSYHECLQIIAATVLKGDTDLEGARLEVNRLNQLHEPYKKHFQYIEDNREVVDKIVEEIK